LSEVQLKLADECGASFEEKCAFARSGADHVRLARRGQYVLDVMVTVIPTSSLHHWCM